MKKLCTIILVIAFLCSCGVEESTGEISQASPDLPGAPAAELSMDKAFEIVRAVTSPEGTYIPVQGLDAEVYSISYLGDRQFSYIVLYFDNSIVSEGHYYFVLSSVVLDTQTSFAPQQVYNRYAVDKHTGKLFIKFLKNSETLGDVNPDYPEP